MSSTSKNFVVGDLVWAKMKGYPYWPGEIMNPPEAKNKKAQHYIFFYGSENHAWIPDENIVPHEDDSVKKYAPKKKGAAFLKAVDKILDNASKADSKSEKSRESIEKEVNEIISLSHQREESEDAAEEQPAAKKQQIPKKMPAPKKKQPAPKKQQASSSEKKPGVSKKDGKQPKGEPDVESPSTSSAGLEAEPEFSGADDDAINPASAARLPPRSAYVERPETPPLDFSTENAILQRRDISPTSKVIGFLGLGKIGQGIVKNLLESGHSVNIWTRMTDKCDAFVSIGARMSSTPFDVVKDSDIIFSCLSDDEATKSIVCGNWGVLHGLSHSLGENKGYVEMAGIDPETSRFLANEIVGKGGRYLEAALNGARSDAIKGTLTVLGAGDKSLFDECESCFKAFTRKARYVGPEIGTALKYNIIHNSLVGTIHTALAEPLALLKNTGVDMEVFMNQLQKSSVSTEALHEKAKAMLDRNFMCDIPLKHIQMQMHIATKMASNTLTPLPVFSATNEYLNHIKRLGYAEHDISAVIEGTSK